MDRHDVPGATAQDVAAAHVSDLEMSAKYDVQFMSYWFDAESGGVFCFAKAPSAENLESLHRASHGLVPNEIISVAEDDVLRFLGRVHDPEDYTQVTSPFRTILFTDLEGSTAMLQAVGEKVFMELLAEHDVIVRRALVTWRGREVKHTGDGIMAAFDDIDAGLRSALQIRDKFSERSNEGDERRLGVRIGMAAGRPVDHNDDLYGSAVVLASRICEAGEAGRVFTSDDVRSRGSEVGHSFRDVGERSLKGFSNPVPVFELVNGTV